MRMIRAVAQAGRQEVIPNRSARAEANPHLEVHVIFTTPEATRAALKATEKLVQGLNARIHLLVPQVVPLNFSLTSPPISIPFIERRSMAMALECRGDAEIRVQVLLCGDRQQCIERVLKPRSLAVIGGKKRWWPTPEQKLAKALQSSGHRVIRVDEE